MIERRRWPRPTPGRGPDAAAVRAAMGEDVRHRLDPRRIDRLGNVGMEDAGYAAHGSLAGRRRGRQAVRSAPRPAGNRRSPGGRRTRRRAPRPKPAPRPRAAGRRAAATFIVSSFTPIWLPVSDIADAVEASASRHPVRGDPFRPSARRRRGVGGPGPAALGGTAPWPKPTSSCPSLWRAKTAMARSTILPRARRDNGRRACGRRRHNGAARAMPAVAGTRCQPGTSGKAMSAGGSRDAAGRHRRRTRAAAARRARSAAPATRSSRARRARRRRLQLLRVEPGLVDAAVEEAPADADDDRDHRSRRRYRHRRHDRSPRRNRGCRLRRRCRSCPRRGRRWRGPERPSHGERRPPAAATSGSRHSATSAPKASIAIRNFTPGAGLGHFEIAGRRGDEDAFDMGGNAGEREQHRRKSARSASASPAPAPRRSGSGRRRRRAGKRGRAPPPCRGWRSPRPAASAARPSWRARRTPPASPSSQPSAPAPASSSPGAQAAGASWRSSRQPLPDQPADQGRDQQAMVEGRAVPPDRDDVGRIAVEESEDRGPGGGEAGEMRAPAGRRPRLRTAGATSASRRRLPARVEADHLGQRRELRLPAIGFLHPLPRGRADAQRRGRDRRADRRSPRPGPPRSSATSRSRPGSASMPSKAAGEATTGLAIAIASSTLFWMPRAMLQRRDDHVGRGEPGADVIDRAGDDHALAGELANGLRTDCGRRWRRARRAASAAPRARTSRPHRYWARSPSGR